MNITRKRISLISIVQNIHVVSDCSVGMTGYISSNNSFYLDFMDYRLSI